MKTIRYGLVLGIPLILTAGQTGCQRRSETEKEPARMPSDQAPQGPGPSSMQEPTPTTPTREAARTREAERNPERTDAPPASAERAGNEAAVSSITRARCDRETRCNNVGSGKKFESHDDCVTKTRASWRDDLNTIECPRGVVDDQLSSCLQQIKNESCGNPLDTLGRALACRAVDLCKAT
jgi:hypothetical protein